MLIPLINKLTTSAISNDVNVIFPLNFILLTLPRICISFPILYSYLHIFSSISNDYELLSLAYNIFYYISKKLLCFLMPLWLKINTSHLMNPFIIKIIIKIILHRFFIAVFYVIIAQFTLIIIILIIIKFIRNFIS